MSRARSVADLGNQNVLTVSATDGNINVGTGVTIENTGEVQFAGIVTAATVQIGAATTLHATGLDLGSGNITSHNITSTGNLSVDGNMNVGGVLTYEDVTSVDSVGVITARDAIVISEDNAIHFRGTDADDNDAILRASADGGQLLINSRNDAIINIDTNNDSTDAHFAVAHGAATGSSTELLRVQENGNIGIGTDDPGTSLEVFTDDDTDISDNTGTNNTNSILRLYNKNGSDGTGVDNYTGIRFDVASGATSSAYLNYVRTGDNQGAFLFKARNASSSYPELLRITSSGNFGIGTANPDGLLHVSGSNPNIYIETANANEQSDIIFQSHVGGDQGSVSYSLLDNSLRFATNGTSNERLRINNAGQVGINITSPLAQLHAHLTEPSGSTSETRTKQHAALRLSLDKTTGSAPYLGWGPAIDFYSDNYDSGTQRPNARIAGCISNTSTNHEGGELRIYTTATDTATGESDFVERFRIYSSGMMGHFGGATANGGNLSNGGLYVINASLGIPASSSRTIRLSGLSSGWATLRGGGYSSAGQSAFSVFYHFGGYMTATHTYDAYTVREWISGGTIVTTKNSQSWDITITNNSSLYQLSAPFTVETNRYNIKLESV